MDPSLQKHQTAPCKLFNKRRAITCYKLQFNLNTERFDHTELYRITNETPGEYYVFPIHTLQKLNNIHLSYHASGAFHWKEVGHARVVPTEGESDHRRVSLICQAMAHISGQLDGYCIAKGRDLTEKAIDVMLDIMDGYVIPPLMELGVNRTLQEKKSHSIPFWESPHRALAQQLIAAEQAKGVKIESANAVWEKIQSQLGPHVRISRAKPEPKYALFSAEFTQILLQISRTLIEAKLTQKSPAFWTQAPES